MADGIKGAAPQGRMGDPGRFRGNQAYIQLRSILAYTHSYFHIHHKEDSGEMLTGVAVVHILFICRLLEHPISFIPPRVFPLAGTDSTRRLDSLAVVHLTYRLEASRNTPFVIFEHLTRSI